MRTHSTRIVARLGRTVMHSPRSAHLHTHISCSPFIFSSTEITFINAFGQAIKAKHSLCHFYVWNKCYTHTDTDTHSQRSKDCFFRNKKRNYEKQKRNGDQGTNDGFGNTSIDSDKSCLGSHSMHVYVCFRARALCDNKNVTVLSLLLNFFFIIVEIDDIKCQFLFYCRNFTNIFSTVFTWNSINGNTLWQFIGSVPFKGFVIDWNVCA